MCNYLQVGTSEPQLKSVNVARSMFGMVVTNDNLAGPTGGIPFDTVFASGGTDLTGPNPVKAMGPHVYTVEWSGSINPIDEDASLRVEILLDGEPVPGSSGFTNLTRDYQGFVSISGGAIIAIEQSGMHLIELVYTTGDSGVIVADANIRLVQIV